MKKNLVLALLATIASLSLVGCGAPKQIKDSITVEAGEKLSLEAEDFFNSADGIEFDTSAVDTSKVGEYEVTATYKKEAYTIAVKVEDTTAPEFELAQDSIVTNDLESLDADSLVESVEDVSDTTAELKFDTEPEEDGEYDASVVVTDESGNSSEKSITVVLDTTAPTISGVEDATVEAEPTVESLQYTAEDSRDGVVECKTSIEKTGDQEYTVTVTATDEAGNTAEETAILTVKKASQQVSSQSSSSAGSKSASQSSSQTASQSTASQSSTPAAEAPTTQPASNPNEVDTSNAVTKEGEIAPGETLTPDSWLCDWCGVDCVTYEGFVEHMKTVHGMQ